MEKGVKIEKLSEKKFLVTTEDGVFKNALFIVRDSKDEIHEMIKDIVNAQADLNSYIDKRRGDYPQIGDQLDAIWKELNYRRLNGDDLTAEADAMLGKILAVKAKYPKEEK